VASPGRGAVASALAMSVLAASAVAVLASASGCEPPRGGAMAQLKVENERLAEQIEQLKADLARREQQIQQRDLQIANLQRLGSKRLDLLYYPVRVEIVWPTGGADYDGKAGDDGVTVYLRPIDQDGHAIKAAGEIRIELFDLAAPDGQRLIGRYVLDVEHAREAWYGRALTYHYTIQCPWRTGPPAHPEITVRATFIDYLTGRELHDTKVCTIRYPPGFSPGSADAGASGPSENPAP